MIEVFDITKRLMQTILNQYKSMYTTVCPNTWKIIMILAATKITRTILTVSIFVLELHEM
jgi:hypothetical protein